MAASTGKFEVYQDAKGEFRWRMVATNGKIVADCGEGYTEKRNCLHGLEVVKALAAGAEVVELPAG